MSTQWGTGNPPIQKAVIQFLKLAVVVGIDKQCYLGSRQSFLSIGTDYILWSWHSWISQCINLAENSVRASACLISHFSGV